MYFDIKDLPSIEILDEAINISSNIYEKLGSSIYGRVLLYKNEKRFIIKGLNFNKFIIRLKQMYDYQGIGSLFEKRYSMWSQMLFNKDRIRRSQMKIVELSVPLFFALEIYQIFRDLADYYDLPFYNKVSNEVWKKTWISNSNKREIQDIETDTTNIKLFNYTLKDYQLEFIKSYKKLLFMYDLEGYILSFEQGLGKTFTAVALAECLNKDKIFIVCPNSLKENWAYEIKSYYKIYSNAKLWLNDVYAHNIPKFKNSKDPKFIIVNQESIDKIFDIAKKFSSYDNMIIVDESHNFRNENSQRSKNLFKLKEILNCKDTLLMSGTPIKATPDEIIPSLTMIDPYFTEDIAQLYRKAFSNCSQEVLRVVKERFGRIIYRKTKKDVLKLPKKYTEELRWKCKDPERYYISTIREQVLQEFDKEYKKKLENLESYRDIFVEYVWKYSSANKQDTKDYIRFTTRITEGKDVNMNQFSDRQLEMFDTFSKDYIYPNMDPKTLKNFKYVEAQYNNAIRSAMGIALGRIMPNARSECFIDIIDYNIDTLIDMVNKSQKKVIIFSQFLRVINHTYDVLTKNNIGCVKIIGETTDRMEVISEFKNSDSIDVLIASTQTLSTGVTLTEANTMFFFGTPYRAADYEQACDRIHRIGQTMDVYIYNVLLDSIEPNISDRINNIMNWSSEMTGEIVNNFINNLTSKGL